MEKERRTGSDETAQGKKRRLNVGRKRKSRRSPASTRVTPLPSTKEMYGMLAQWISNIRDGFSSITSNPLNVLWGSHPPGGAKTKPRSQLSRPLGAVCHGTVDGITWLQLSPSNQGINFFPVWEKVFPNKKGKSTAKKNFPGQTSDRPTF